jgi:hypothetical protein
MVFIVVTVAIVWLIKYLVAHRRWLRATKMQSDVHGRLLERFSSNEELLAYVQSPAGSHFLKATPMPAVESVASPVGAPFNRILWSVQAGLVVAFGGAGLFYVGSRMGLNPNTADAELPLFAIGLTALAVGIGFVVSAVFAYLLSKRLGLLTPPGAPGSDSGTLPAERA